MATRKTGTTTKTATVRKLTLKKETVKDLAPGGRAVRVQGGRLPETKGCPKLGPN
jgi:hypothetical protein